MKKLILLGAAVATMTIFGASGTAKADHFSHGRRGGSFNSGYCAPSFGYGANYATRGLPRGYGYGIGHHRLYNYGRYPIQRSFGRYDGRYGRRGGAVRFGNGRFSFGIHF